LHFNQAGGEAIVQAPGYEDLLSKSTWEDLIGLGLYVQRLMSKGLYVLCWILVHLQEQGSCERSISHEMGDTSQDSSYGLSSIPSTVSVCNMCCME
jgi:hypothetical protein